MTLSLLQICQNVARNAGVSAPTTIIGNTEPGAERLLQMARRAAISLANKANWTALVVEHVFVADGSSDYPLPSDMRSIVDGTIWDRSRYWEMRGPLSPQQWQMYKSSTLGQATVYRRWRMRLPSGSSAGDATVFSIDPPLSSDDTSSEFVFEYVSNNWARRATTYALEHITIAATGSGYVDGDVLTVAGGTVTTAAQILVTSTVAGAITAAEVSVPGSYTVRPTSPASVTGGTGTGATFTITAATMPGATSNDWAADTDTPIVDDNLLEMGMLWRLLSRTGFAYAEERDEYERELDKAIARDGGAAVLSLVPPLCGPNGTYIVNPVVWNELVLNEGGGSILLNG